VRQAFAHDAIVTMEAGGDERAPGAAITVALCGDWDHEPPCPLAPHHTSVQRPANEGADQRPADEGTADQSTADRRPGDRRPGDQVLLRVLFATEPAAEAEVRRRIQAALSRSSLTGPDGLTTHWRLLSAQPALLRADESQHAEQLIQS
jgi:hypothetical protein